MADNKRKHLEFIQAAISRMAQSSLLVKGWSITITAALLALEAKDPNPKLALIPIPVVLLFWWLNSFFLTTEKRFRSLFDGVRLKEEKDIDFDMNIESYSKGASESLKNMFAKTLWPFHGLILSCALASLFAIKPTQTTVESNGSSAIYCCKCNATSSGINMNYKRRCPCFKREKDKF